jgi:hypothetical protein
LCLFCMLRPAIGGMTSAVEIARRAPTLTQLEDQFSSLS